MVKPKIESASIMFHQTILGLMVAIVVITCTCVMPIASKRPGCLTDIIELVQITTMRLDAGIQTFEAFRILRSGMVEWARWDSSRNLLDHAQPLHMGSETFDRVVSSPSFLNPPKPTNENDVLKRQAFRLDMAILSGSGIKAVSITKMPNDISEIIEKIRSGVKPIAVQPGCYIWTQPYPQIGRADIDITGANRDSAIAMVLDESIASGRLIVRADDSIKSYFSSEHANRIAFLAKLPIGNLLFGVLFAN